MDFRLIVSATFWGNQKEILTADCERRNSHAQLEQINLIMVMVPYKDGPHLLNIIIALGA